MPTATWKAVVWNIAGNDAAWAHLRRLRPDVMLLNEARVPARLTGAYSSEGTIGRDGGKRPWSAAVVSRHPLSQISEARARNFRGIPKRSQFETSRPGAWYAALITIPGVGDVTVVSLYGLLDEISDSSVHRSLSEISPVFDDPRYGRLVLLGGDLNTATQWPRHSPYLARDRVVLDRIRAYGLVDCLAAKRPPGRVAGCRCAFGDECTHVRTRLDRRWPHIPYQTDYLFASNDLAERLLTCEAISSSTVHAISDHTPIVATFRLR